MKKLISAILMVFSASSFAQSMSIQGAFSTVPLVINTTLSGYRHNLYCHTEHNDHRDARGSDRRW